MDNVSSFSNLFNDFLKIWTRFIICIIVPNIKFFFENKQFTILIAKDKILIATNICDYKPYIHLGQVAKDNQLQKTPCGMYSHINICILLVITKSFHPLTSCRTMRLHKIFGIIEKIN